MKSHLILDSDFLCHRVFNSSQWVPGFSFLASAFLRQVESLVRQFDPDFLSFCFDSRKSARRKTYQKYKQARRDLRKAKTEEEKEDWLHFCEERRKLKYTLRQLGFRNVLFQSGYEADDLMALVLQACPEDSATIVTCDADLYQLLSPRVQIYLANPKKLYTHEDFQKEWGLTPSQWIDVKSIAGCSSDNIIGIEGVGEKTAAKYLRGELPSGSKAYRKIVEKGHLWKRNYELVGLPFAGARPVQVRSDKPFWKFREPIKGIRNGRKAKGK